MTNFLAMIKGELQRRSIDLALSIGGRDFLVGYVFSLADVIMAPMVNCAGAMPEGEELPGLRRVMDNLTQRPSFVAATQPPAA